MAKPKAIQESREDKAQRAVQSVEVGGRILLALADSPAAMNLKDLSAAAGMTPSRAHSYLVSYVRLGLIVQDSLGRYDLGPAALRIGLTCLQRLDPLKAAEPLVEALAAQTGHTVAIAVWGNFGPTVVKLLEAKVPLHISMRIGSVLSVFDTASGRAFASVMAQDMLRQAVAGPFGELLSPSELRQRWGELDAIRADFRKHGLARAAGSPIPGVNAFSAPVFDLEGTPALVITVIDQQDRLSSSWSAPTAKALLDVADRISVSLGGSRQALA